VIIRASYWIFTNGRSNCITRSCNISIIRSASTERSRKRSRRTAFSLAATAVHPELIRCCKSTPAVPPAGTASGVRILDFEMSF